MINFLQMMQRKLGWKLSFFKEEQIRNWSHVSLISAEVSSSPSAPLPPHPQLQTSSLNIYLNGRKDID